MGEVKWLSQIKKAVNYTKPVASPGSCSVLHGLFIGVLLNEFSVSNEKYAVQTQESGIIR